MTPILTTSRWTITKAEEGEDEEDEGSEKSEAEPAHDPLGHAKANASVDHNLSDDPDSDNESLDDNNVADSYPPPVVAGGSLATTLGRSTVTCETEEEMVKRKRVRTKRTRAAKRAL
jgi:hypothetical protein